MEKHIKAKKSNIPLYEYILDTIIKKPIIKMVAVEGKKYSEVVKVTGTTPQNIGAVVSTFLSRVQNYISKDPTACLEIVKDKKSGVIGDVIRFIAKKILSREGISEAAAGQIIKKAIIEVGVPASIDVIVNYLVKAGYKKDVAYCIIINQKCEIAEEDKLYDCNKKLRATDKIMALFNRHGGRATLDVISKEMREFYGEDFDEQDINRLIMAKICRLNRELYGCGKKEYITQRLFERLFPEDAVTALVDAAMLYAKKFKKKTFTISEFVEWMESEGRDDILDSLHYGDPKMCGGERIIKTILIKSGRFKSSGKLAVKIANKKEDKEYITMDQIDWS